MKKHLFLTFLTSVSLCACAQEAPKVKHKKTVTLSEQELKNIKVVNAEDPVCHMKTAEFLKDTAVYQHKTYGFCSASCKEEFKKRPAKYVRQ
ncbi:MULTISPECIES: YHS domain-containing protein [Chryseobacterium]|uniref:YHS domain-containing protein n=1 Tax=Chryseobacterium camelliae TaxID=1265445 RepID=A0ABU0TND6_9FLAO|nr:MULTISPECIES: YHS domain-containing protein [Chryseobacterium]MDT3407584.1 YHS domain-containing protein [Pseudacidovorax intermedius]MDQ1098563.1 YHS domain-containing protein [Chryseobacterium camelliae]MDQ1102487.1 YHS domain-containing protein [Chryseobacterium sp. SORGH_AS_1048]MDR6085921.1 YHS domain-containing protein [Chryseobacterium sp. SORGH_AS_0909]MDR6130287.1 YHS domain-containing protein [Chryseobacterium sp. SORGH_AS_1175]